MPLPKAADDLINEFFDPQDSFYLEPIIKSNLLTTAEKYILFRAVLASPEPPPPPDEKKRTPEEQHLAQAQAAQEHFFPYLDWLYLIDPPGELVASFKTLHDFLHNTEVHRGYDGQGAVLAIKHFFGGLLGNNLSPQVTTKIQHAVRRKVNDYLVTLNIKALSKELGDAKQAMNEGCIDWRFSPDTGHLLHDQISYRMPESVHTNIYKEGKDNLLEILKGAPLKFPKGVRYFTGVLQTNYQILPFKACSISLLYYTTNHFNFSHNHRIQHLDQTLAHLSEDTENRIQLLRYCLEFYFLDVIQNTSPASKEKTLATIFQNLKMLKQLAPDDEFGVICHDTFEFYQKKFEGSEDKLNALDRQSVAYQWLLLNRGATYSQQKQSDLAIADFDRLLQVNPCCNITRTLRGNAYLQQKEFEAAIIDFNDALEINPINIMALVGRGEIYLQQGNYDAAIADFTHTLQIDHNNAAAFANRGEAYYQQKKFDLAIVEFTHALKIKPNSAAWLADRGWVYRLQGKLDLAINDSEQALKIEPQNRNALTTCRKAYFARGEKYFQDKKYDLAIADFTRVLQIESNDLLALCNRGTAHYNKYKDDLAITDLTHALQIDPNHVHTLYMRGLTYSRQEEYNLAISDFTSLLQINPNNAAAFVERGKVYHQQKKYDLSINDLEQVLKIEPDNNNALTHCKLAYLERGIAFLNNREANLAIKDFTRVLQIAPNDFFALCNRGIAHYSKYENDLAITDLTHALQIDPNHVHTLYMRGLAYSREGEYNLAISDFTSLLQIDPNKATAFVERGKTYSKQQKFDLAISDFTSLLQIDPNNTTAFVERGETYSKQQKFDLAISDFTQALQINPNNVTGLIARSRTYYWKLNNFDLAISDLKQALKISPGNKDVLYWYKEIHNVHGTKYVAEEKFDLAIAEFTKSLEMDPQDKDALEKCAKAYQLQGNFRSAIRYFKILSRVDQRKRNHVLEICKGIRQLKKELGSVAFVHFDNALQTNPQTVITFTQRCAGLDAYQDVYKERASKYLKEGKVDLAIVDFTSILYISPTDESVLMDRAELYEREKKFDLALADLTLAIQSTEPCDYMYHLELLRRGEVYLKKGELDLAIADFSQYFVAAQNDPDRWLHRDVLSNRGVAYCQKKEFDLAIADFTRALEIQPNDPLLLAELEKTRRQQKEAKEALDLAMRDFFQDFSADCVRELEMSNAPVQANLVEDQPQPKAVSLSPKQEEKKEEEGLEIDANCSPSFVMTAKVGAYPYGCNQPMDGSPLGQGRQANGQQAVAAKEEKSDRAHRSSSRRKKEKSDRIHRSSSQRKKEKSDRTHHSSSRRKEENPDRVHRQSSRRRAHTSSFGHSNLFKPPSAPREKDGFVWVEKEKRKQTIVDNNYVLVETDMAINGLDAGKNYSCVIL